MTGQRFERLVVIERAGKAYGGQAAWRCKCGCGAETVLPGSALRSGRTRSCGCLRTEVLRRPGRGFRHGLSKAPEYFALHNARSRCRKPSHRFYADYGGRGIEYRLPEDMGEAVMLLVRSIGRRPDGMTLDRIDNDGHYEVGNLRWATRSEQLSNQRRQKEARASRAVEEHA